MGNWLFLMLLYAFFGWMKKKQRDKAREKIESQESWDTRDVVEFGEGILDSILGEEGDKKDEIISEQNVYENEERNLDIEIIEPDKEHDEIPNNIIFDEIDTKPEVGEFTQDEVQQESVDEEAIEE